MGMEHAYTYAAAGLIDQVDRALSAVEGEPARVAVESSLAHTLRRLGCRSDNPLEWKPSWDWERELSDELMIEAYLKAKWRCGVETVTTAGWEESEKGPLRPEAWRTTERRKRVLGPLLFETIRHGWNNSGLACDFARNLAKQGIATWSDVTEWGTGEVLTWPQM